MQLAANNKLGSTTTLVLLHQKNTLRASRQAYPDACHQLSQLVMEKELVQRGKSCTTIAELFVIKP